MKKPIDLEEFKRIKRDLRISSSDSLVVMQMIQAFDYLTDVIVDLTESLEHIRRRLEYAESDLEHLMEKEDEV